MAETFDIISDQIIPPHTKVWRIDSPNVKQARTEYPSIRFLPGDQITITAGGCVQTGGHGKTWKRYVDPQGPNADRLYHGLIQIPGVHSSLVRINTVINHTVTIPTNANPANLTLTLGYEDDGYGDNGYTAHDDGTGDQCKGQGAAWVSLSVVSPNAPAVVVAPEYILTASFANPTHSNSPEWANNVCLNNRFLANDSPPYEWTQVTDTSAARMVDFDSPLVGLTGTTLLPQLSGTDLPFSHPFGNDWECYVAPDPPYQSLLASSNKGGPGADDYGNAANHASNDLHLAVPAGVMGIEWDAAFIPPAYQPADGDRIAVLGRWIIDCGHEDFHAEIHPPLLLARAAITPDKKTHSTLIGRPYLVAQTYTVDQLPLRKHLLNELRKAATPIPFLGSLQIEAHPNIMPRPFSAGIHTMTYVLRPPAQTGPLGGITALSEVFVQYHFTVRTGVSISLSPVGNDAVQVTITLDGGAYQPPPLPPRHNRDLNINDLAAQGGISSLEVDALRGLAAFAAPSAEIALLRSILTDSYDVPHPQSATDSHITTSALSALHPGMSVGSLDNSQPFPIYGWIDVYRGQKPVIVKGI